jgi:hypothetical protein
MQAANETVQVVVLDDVRRERETLPARTLARTLVAEYRSRRLEVPETLKDAQRTVYSLRFRALAAKLDREVRRAIDAGVPAYLVNRALRQYADAIAPFPLTMRREVRS